MKRYENGLDKWDFQEESLKANPFLKTSFGRDQYTFKPETLALRNLHLSRTEASFSHGYPVTAWLQLGLCYGCAVYTAQEQGVFTKG